MARDISYETLCHAPPFVSDGKTIIWLSADDKNRINLLLRKNVPRLSLFLGITPDLKNHGETCRKISRWYKYNIQPSLSNCRCNLDSCNICNPKNLFNIRQKFLLEKQT